MKKTLLLALLFSGATAIAGGHPHNGHRNHGGYQNYNHGGYYNPGYYNRGYRYNNWVAPAVIGGMIGYGVATSPYYAPGYYAPPPIYIEQPVPYAAPAPMYETVWSPSCRCYRTIPRYYN